MQQYTVKELRARKNETQAETARALCVSIQTYNAWEKEISNIAVSKVLALARHFGVTLGEIFLPCDMKDIHVDGASTKRPIEK